MNNNTVLLFCDGSCAHRTRVAVGILIRTTTGEKEYSMSISQTGSCNQSEYHAIITGLKLCINNNDNDDDGGTKKQNIHVFSDSQVVIRQLQKKYKINHELRKLYDKTRNLEKYFNTVTYTWLPRETPEIRRVNRLAQECNHIRIIH